MKKRILISVMMVMILCMSGCIPEGLMDALTQQGTGSEQAEVSENESESEKESESWSDIEDENNTGSADATQESATEYLAASTSWIYDGYYDEIHYMYGHYGVIELVAPDYPALEEAVTQYNYTHAQEGQQIMSDLREWSTSDYQEFPDSFFGPYVYEEDMYLTRADSKALSVVSYNYSYTGGAHGSTYFGCVNFDSQTGRELALEDVVINTSALPAALTTELVVKYPDIENMWEDSWEEHFASYLTPPIEYDTTPYFTWTLGYDNVTFYFGSYELGTYADGVQTVTLTYEKYPELFDASYFENTDDNYVLQLMRNGAGDSVGEYDLDGDGNPVEIVVSGNYNDEYELDYHESFNVTVNGNTFTHEAYCFYLDVYLAKAHGNTYLYVNRTLENDYQSAYVFQITESSVEYVGEFTGGFTSFTNTLNFGVGTRRDLLSTFYATAQCYIGDDGMPVEKGGVYVVDYELSITSTVAITAELVDDNGNLTGESKTFPAGTEYTFEKTDGMTYVDMLTSDGSRCRLYTTADWPPTVNGMDATSSFEMLWYAG